MQKMNKEEYTKLVNQDIRAIEREMKDSLERKHIISILKDSIRLYYSMYEPLDKQQFTPKCKKFSCGACGKVIEELFPESGCLDEGVDLSSSGGYGSKYDLTPFQLYICDDCLEGFLGKKAKEELCGKK